MVRAQRRLLQIVVLGLLTVTPSQITPPAEALVCSLSYTAVTGAKCNPETSAIPCEPLYDGDVCGKYANGRCKHCRDTDSIHTCGCS